MITRGPFTITWGDNTIEDIENVDITHEVTADTYESAKGKSFEIDKTEKAEVMLTLLSTDIASLAAVLPQHFVPFGDTLSTGQVVDAAEGAIDPVPRKCNLSITYHDLDITSCANPGQITRIVHARSKFDGIEVTNRIQKIKVKFLGESGPSEAVVQILRAPDTNPHFLKLEDGGYLLTEDGERIII